MVFGCISIIFFMITFLFTKERVTEDNSNNQVKVPVIQGFKALIKNKYWFIMTLTLVLIFVVMGRLAVQLKYIMQEIYWEIHHLCLNYLLH